MTRASSWAASRAEGSGSRSMAPVNSSICRRSVVSPRGRSGEPLAPLAGACCKISASAMINSYPLLAALHAEHRRVPHLQLFARPQVHVHPAWQAGVEAPHRAHDIDPLERVLAVLLEDRRVLYRILVRAGRAQRIARAGVPRRRRIRVIVGDLAV